MLQTQAFATSVFPHDREKKARGLGDDSDGSGDGVGGGINGRCGGVGACGEPDPPLDSGSVSGPRGDYGRPRTIVWGW